MTLTCYITFIAFANGENTAIVLLALSEMLRLQVTFFSLSSNHCDSFILQDGLILCSCPQSYSFRASACNYGQLVLFLWKLSFCAEQHYGTFYEVVMTTG